MRITKQMRDRDKYLINFLHYEGFAYDGYSNDKATCWEVYTGHLIDITFAVKKYFAGEITHGRVLCYACRLLHGADPESGIAPDITA